MEELTELAALPDPGDALRRVMQSAVEWDDDELIRNQFWVAVLAEPERSVEMQAHLDEAAAEARSVILSLLERCHHPHPAAAADGLYLLAAGFFVSMVESPHVWEPRRTVAAAGALVDAVLAACS